METLRFKNDGRMRDGSNIQMPTGKQHVEINRKMWLRRQLCSKANPEGVVYVPYARKQYNFWLKQHALPWVQRIINPYAIIGVKFGLRRQMVYWGGVIIV